MEPAALLLERTISKSGVASAITEHVVGWRPIHFVRDVSRPLLMAGRIGCVCRRKTGQRTVRGILFRLPWRRRGAVGNARMLQSGASVGNALGGGGVGGGLPILLTGGQLIRRLPAVAIASSAQPKGPLKR